MEMDPNKVLVGDNMKPDKVVEALKCIKSNNDATDEISQQSLENCNNLIQKYGDTCCV